MAVSTFVLSLSGLIEYALFFINAPLKSINPAHSKRKGITDPKGKNSWIEYIYIKRLSRPVLGVVL